MLDFESYGGVNAFKSCDDLDFNQKLLKICSGFVALSISSDILTLFSGYHLFKDFFLTRLFNFFLTYLNN